MVPQEIKNSGSARTFKTNIQYWEPRDCYCYLCKTYKNNLGFVNVIQMRCLHIPKVLVDIFWTNILMCYHVL